MIGASQRIRQSANFVIKLPPLAKFLLNLGYTTGEFGKNHLGDHRGLPSFAAVQRSSVLTSRGPNQAI